MSNKITGQEYPLSKIFSSDFDFQIPPYQRPYAWTETEASELFDDLYDSYKRNQTEDYFLGSIVLIKEENKPYAEVIDGQQRLTTLTILLASIADQATGDVRAEFLDYIKEPGKKTLGLPAKPRLALRKTDKEFFFEYIQSLQFNKLFDLQKDQLKTEAQEHIQKNARLFISRMIDKFSGDQQDILGFGSFIVRNCYLVAVSSPSKTSAFRVFSVLNNRGLDLLPSDIIKADVIGKISPAKQNKYTEQWESIENQTGRGKFNDLFGHIRMIFSRRKQQNTLLEEFDTYVMGGMMTPESLIDDVIQPYAESFRILTKCDYQSSENAQPINSYLNWLNKINKTDWLPPAILYFSQHHPQEDVLKFVQKLERLAAFMHICAENVNYRIERYAKIIDEINKGTWPQSIELQKKEIIKMRKCLDGDIYTDLTSARRNYLILRLDSFVSDGEAQYTPATLTIEHVLPQTPEAGSQWLSWWPDEEERNRWTHRIANLVPLPRQKNSEAQNYEFQLKKDKYFKGKYGTSSYTLTTQVLNMQEWTPMVLAERQQALLNAFSKKWELECDVITEALGDDGNGNGRMKNFKFSDYGIPVGAELAFFRKPSITCTIVDENNRVKYNGDEYSLSALAKKLLFEQSGKDWKSARGADHFLYKGKKLSNMTLIAQSD